MSSPRSRSDLENHVLKYLPGVGERLKDDPVAKAKFAGILDRTHAEYEPFVSRSVPGKVVRAGGKTSGYLGDLLYWGVGSFVPGWSIPALAMKGVSMFSQLPGKLYNSVSYAAKTGDYLGALENVVGGVVSFFPGATVLDRGLAKISQKRMAKKALYRVKKELGIESKRWHTQVAEDIAADYTGVEDRKKNVVSPHYGGLEAAVAA